MTDLKDIFRLFPSSKSALKLDSLNREKLTPSIVHLFNEVVDEILQVSNTNSESTCSVEDVNYFPKLLLKIDSVLNYVWEQLHTGEWKNVDETWRQLYSYLSIFKSFVCLKLATSNDEKVKEQLVNAVQCCDMGLIMGAPVLDGLLNTIADSINSKLSNLLDSKKSRLEQPVDCERECEQQQISVPLLDNSKIIEVLNQPSIEKFISEIVHKKPVIVTGAMDFWPAMGKSQWSLDYLRKIAGYRTVPIEIGSKYTDDTWSQSLTTVNEFIDNFIAKANKTTGYLAQYQLFQQIPQLREDIIIPDYCYVGESDEDVQVNAWFGPQGTISPLHYDPDHNFLSQIVGSKYIRLYSQEYTSLLYPHEGMLSNTSQVDVEHPDLTKFPLFSNAPYFECILKPGSMLYIPPKMWHYVRSLSTSFSVSFWWK